MPDRRRSMHEKSEELMTVGFEDKHIALGTFEFILTKLRRANVGINESLDAEMVVVQEGDEFEWEVRLNVIQRYPTSS